MSIEAWGILGAFALNLAGFIWGAAGVKKEVEHLSRAVDKLSDKMEDALAGVSTTLSNHGERLGRLEGRAER